MELSVYNRSGVAVEKLNFDENVLGNYINYDLLHQAVVAFEANQRLGTHYTKNRRAVICRKGKPFRQKGTGNARMGYRGRVGSRGGARAHGPKPRDYRQELPAKSRRAALKSALLGKFRDNEIVVVADLLASAAPKTQTVAKFLRHLKIDKSCLFITAKHDVNIYKSVRNIQDASVLPLSDIHAYAVLKPTRVVITKDALLAIPQEFK
jgi:large subunit ribosomal protein L4